MHELGQPGPLAFQFEYETYTIPDEISIRYEDKEVFRVRVATGAPVLTAVSLPAGTSTQVEITVVGPPGTTEWNYKVSCPTGPTSTGPASGRPGG